MPSHHTPPSGVSATLVKIEFVASVAMAFGLVFSEVPGATPKNPASGLIARSRPFASGLIQAMSSPTVQTFQPFEALGRNQHGEICLAAGAGKGRGDVSLFALRILRRRRSACARPSSLRRARCWKRCAAQNISCRAAHCRRSPNRRTRSRAFRESERCISLCCRATAHPSARLERRAN